MEDGDYMKLKGYLNDVKCWIKTLIDEMKAYTIRKEITIIENENSMLERTLNFCLHHGDHIYLDGEVLDKKTFEFVREALPSETEMFYTIRLNELKIKELKGTLPENKYRYNKFIY